MLSSSPKLRKTTPAARKVRSINMNFRISEGLYTNTREFSRVSLVVCCGKSANSEEILISASSTDEEDVVKQLQDGSEQPSHVR